MGFFTNLLGSAINTGVKTLVSTGIKTAFAPKSSVRVIGAAGAGTKGFSADDELRSVLDDTKSGFVGTEPSVGGILPRSAGRADPARSLTQDNFLPRAIQELQRPQVSSATGKDLLKQIQVATFRTPTSSRRSPLRKLKLK